MKPEHHARGRRFAGVRRIALLWFAVAAATVRGEWVGVATLDSVPGLISPFEVRGWGLTGESVVAGYRLGQMVNSPSIVTGSVEWVGDGVSLVVLNALEPGSDGLTNTPATPPTNAYFTVLDSVASFNSVTVRGVDMQSVEQFRQAARVVGVACGEFHTLLLRRDGTVGATGWNVAGQTNVPLSATNVVSIACGLDHSIAIRRDGTAVVWGVPSVRGAPVAEPMGPSEIENRGFIAAAGGAAHSVFLRRNGRVVVAGRRSDTVQSPPASLTNAVAIAAGAYHNIALTSDRRLVEWGVELEDHFGTSGGTGGPGEPDDDKWPRIRRAGDVVAVAAGGYFSMVLHADRTVSAWGDGEFGETDVPTSATNVVAISAGTYHALALRADGTVVAWGASEGGVTDVPAGLTNVVAIAAGGYHNQVLVQTQPVLTLPRLRAGNLVAEVNLPAGMRYRLQGTLDLATWNTISTNLAVPGEMTLETPAGTRPFLLVRAVPILP